MPRRGGTIRAAQGGGGGLNFPLGGLLPGVGAQAGLVNSVANSILGFPVNTGARNIVGSSLVADINKRDTFGSIEDFLRSFENFDFDSLSSTTQKALIRTVESKIKQKEARKARFEARKVRQEEKKEKEEKEKTGTGTIDAGAGAPPPPAQPPPAPEPTGVEGSVKLPESLGGHEVGVGIDDKGGFVKISFPGTGPIKVRLGGGLPSPKEVIDWAKGIFGKGGPTTGPTGQPLPPSQPSPGGAVGPGADPTDPTFEGPVPGEGDPAFEGETGVDPDVVDPDGIDLPFPPIIPDDEPDEPPLEVEVPIPDEEPDDIEVPFPDSDLNPHEGPEPGVDVGPDLSIGLETSAPSFSLKPRAPLPTLINIPGNRQALLSAQSKGVGRGLLTGNKKPSINEEESPEAELVFDNYWTAWNRFTCSCSSNG